MLLSAESKSQPAHVGAKEGDSLPAEGHARDGALSILVKGIGTNLNKDYTVVVYPLYTWMPWVTYNIPALSWLDFHDIEQRMEHSTYFALQYSYTESVSVRLHGKTTCPLSSPSADATAGIVDKSVAYSRL